MIARICNRPRLVETDFDLNMVEFRESKAFNFATLALLGGCMILVTALQWQRPTNTTSKAPQAVLPLPKAVSVSKASIDLVEGRDASPLAGRFTVSDLNTAFDQLGYELPPVLAGTSPVPRLFLTSLPYDLNTIKQTKERKAMFFKTLLPLVLKINEEIITNRAKIWRLSHRLNLGQAIRAEDRIWLNAAFNKYGVKYNDFDSLLTRMDVVPPSLALAQAAEESGWGTSRFVREGNALFGQWTFNPKDKGIVPTGRAEGKTHRIRAFDSLSGSLKAYVQNLNTHKAYKKLRSKRLSMRKNREKLNGFVLATALDKYSERGGKYVTSLQAIMDKNDLRRFDATSLGESKDIDLNGPLI